MFRMLHLFVGCLNRAAPYFAHARGVGLAAYAFDEDTLAFEKRAETGDIDNPTFLTVDPATRCIYANSEVFGWKEGVVSSYRFEPDSGSLIYLNKQPTLGSIAAHNSLTRDGRFLMVANYGMGEGGPDQSVAVFGRNEDGSLTPAISSVANRGTGPNSQRQERSHTHCVAQFADGGLVVVSDLGLDRIFSYRVGDDGSLSEGRRTGRPAGRGTAAHRPPPGRPELFRLQRTRFDDRLAAQEARTVLLSRSMSSRRCPRVRAESHGADIHVSPDGRFVYGSNRGHDSIAIFRIEQGSGKLEPLGHAPSGGNTPRNFAITPSGRHLVVANQDSDAIAFLERDAESGMLRDTGRRLEIGTPMCVRVTAF